MPSIPPTATAPHHYHAAACCLVHPANVFAHNDHSAENWAWVLYDVGSSEPAKEPTLADYMMKQLLDWLLAGAMELASKGKWEKMMVPSTMALLAKLPFILSAEAVEVLIEGEYDDDQK